MMNHSKALGVGRRLFVGFYVLVNFTTNSFRLVNVHKDALRSTSSSPCSVELRYRNPGSGENADEDHSDNKLVVSSHQRNSNILPFVYKDDHNDDDEEMVMDQEWHDSFMRNGFTDFVPPIIDLKSLKSLILDSSTLSNQLNMITEEEELKLLHDHHDHHDFFKEGDENPKIRIGDAQVGISDQHDLYEGNSQKDDSEEVSLQKNRAAATSLVHRPQYDIIFDPGLMNHILLALRNEDDRATAASDEKNTTDMLVLEQLLGSTSQALREHGIYVMITNNPVSDKTKSYFIQMGRNLGMQWKFEFDGISKSSSPPPPPSSSCSNDGHRNDRDGVFVSIARRYSTDVLPSSFWKKNELLLRLIEDGL